MAFASETIDSTSAGTLLFAIPEIVGVFAFGVGLVLIAFVIRWFMTRLATVELDQKES